MKEFIERNIMKIFFIMFFIVSTIALILIWIPRKLDIPDFAYYTEKSDEEIISKMGKYYLDDVKILLMLSQDKAVVDKLSKEYLEYYGITEEEAINMLYEVNAMSLDVKFINSRAYTNGQHFVYTVDIQKADTTLTMNLVEIQPYNYVITFGSFIGYLNTNYKTSSENVDLSIKKAIQFKDYIEYELNILNNSNSELTANLSSYKDAYAMYSDKTSAGILNPIKYDNETVNQGGEINKSIKFEIPLNSQSSIREIIFNNFLFNGIKKEVKLSL